MARARLRPRLKNYAGAIGGYFKISNSKSSDYNNPVTLIPNLNLNSRFDLPTRDEMNGWNITITNISAAVGDDTSRPSRFVGFAPGWPNYELSS